MSQTLSPPAPNACIELQVGERRFTTRASTLSDGSSFFASLLSERWQDSRSDDGSYFIDADPDLFAHILRYLRRGLLPVVYDKLHGFDHAFYQALREEAVYFGIEPLENWITEKGYLRAVTIHYSVEEVQGQGIYVDGYKAAVDGNTERSYHPSWGIRKVYQCPRGISLHNGNPEACGKACEKAKGEDWDGYVEQSVLRTLIVTRRTVFNGTSQYTSTILYFANTFRSTLDSIKVGKRKYNIDAMGEKHCWRTSL
jgi:BTB/POZ domain-containing protein KCTD9